MARPKSSNLDKTIAVGFSPWTACTPAALDAAAPTERAPL
jgi:hypothetical protein